MKANVSRDLLKMFVHSAMAKGVFSSVIPGGVFVDTCLLPLVLRLQDDPSDCSHAFLLH